MLLEHPGVQEAAVVGAPDADLGQRVVAHVVGGGVDEPAHVEHVTTVLSWHKRPREIRFVDPLSRNAIDKIQTTRLTDS